MTALKPKPTDSVRVEKEDELFPRYVEIELGQIDPKPHGITARAGLIGVKPGRWGSNLHPYFRASSELWRRARLPTCYLLTATRSANIVLVADRDKNFVVTNEER